MLQKFNELDSAVQTTIANWLNICGLLRHQYARSMSSSKAKADGLFVWLAVHCAKQYLNLMHASGIWTSCKSEYVVITDPAIVLLISGFLSVTKMGMAELLDDSVYLAQFKNLIETQEHFTPVPQVLNKPVIDLGSHLEEIRIHVCGDCSLLHHIMARLFECAPDMLQQQLWQWVLHFSHDVHMIEKWLAVRGLDLAEFLSYLESNRESDGLELWLLSLASDCPINVVMDDRVFLTGISRVDFDCPTVVLLPSCEAYLCELDTLEDEFGAAAALPPLTVALVSWGGRQLAAVPEYPDLPDLSDENTNPNMLLEMENKEVQVNIPISSRAIPQECPVCEEDLPCGMALYRHLRSQHPEQKLYQCHDCEHQFNNL